MGIGSFVLLAALAAEPRAGAAEPGPPVDVAIVLGAGSPPEGWANPLLVERVCRGVAEHRAGRAKALLVTGGYTAGHIAEAEMMRAVAVAAGLQPEDVWTEPSAVNTIENAVFSARVARRKGARTAALVTHRSHMAWAREAFERAGGPWRSLASIEADGAGGCLKAARPLALGATVDMLIVDVTEEAPLEAFLERPADVPTASLVDAALAAAEAYKAGAAKRLYFAEPEPSTGTFTSGWGSAHGHISRTELARILASAAGVAWDDLYISSARRAGQIPGAVEPGEDPWLRIPGARLAVLAPVERRPWWEARFRKGLNAQLARPEFLSR